MAGCTIERSNREFDQVNREGTLNVARECRNVETPPLLLFVSSLAAAGPAVRGRPRTERDPPAPVSAYGRSKLAAEEGLRRMAGELPIQVVRPPSVFGDSDRYTLPLFKSAKAGWVFLAGGEHSYSFIHVDDLARALLHVSTCDAVRVQPLDESGNSGQQDHACTAASNPGTVHLAQDPAMSFAEIASVIRESIGRDGVRSLHVPAMFCWALAATNSIGGRALRRRPLLNLDKMREAMAGAWISDNRRLTEELGFEFQVSLHARIRETAESYQEKGWL